MPLLRYGFRDSLNQDVDSLLVQFEFARFDIYRAMCDILEWDGRIMEAITCFQLVQRELCEDTSIHNERTQWELSERYREQHNQRLAEHGTQVFNSDAQRSWRSSAKLQ